MKQLLDFPVKTIEETELFSGLQLLDSIIQLLKAH